MPLSKGSSPKSFSKNVKIEMEHGKPQKQAVAIAYSVKRKMKHKAHGGEMEGCQMCSEGGGVENEKLHPYSQGEMVEDDDMDPHYSNSDDVADDFLSHDGEEEDYPGYDQDNTTGDVDRMPEEDNQKRRLGSIMRGMRMGKLKGRSSKEDKY